MSDHRDRAEIHLDEHVQKMLTYMQRNVPTHKLIGVADAIQKSARLLWEQYPQEPLQGMTLCEASIVREIPPASIESCQAPVGADGDSVAAICDSQQ